MIIYDRTLSDRNDVRQLVDNARINITKDKLGFRNNERFPDEPKIKNLPADLLRQLAQLLDKRPLPSTDSPMAPYAEIIYGGDPNCGKGNRSTPGPWACTQGTSIWLFDRWVIEKDPERQAAVLAHELIHVLCGNELDSEITENVMFEKGSTIDPSDVYCIRNKRWRGRWFRVVKPPRINRNSQRPIDVRYGWRDSIGPDIIKSLLEKLRQSMTEVSRDPADQVRAFDEMLADVPVEA